MEPCIRCQFFEPELPEKRRGWCRKSAPALGEDHYKARRPFICHPEFGCGDFQRKTWEPRTAAERPTERDVTGES